MQHETDATHNSEALAQPLSPESWASPSATVDPGDPRRRKRMATAVALEAVLLGLAGDGLLKTQELGINLVLWTACAVIAFISLARRRAENERAWQWAFTVPVLFFASVFAWRDAEPLLVLNMLAMLSAFAVLAMVFLGHPANARKATLIDYIEGAFGIGLSGAVGAIPLLATDGALRNAGTSSRRGAIMGVARGLIIAVPVLLVFGALLSSADARFEKLMRVVFDIDGEAAIGHLLFSGFVAWVTAGYLRGALVAYRPLGITLTSETTWRPTLGIAELGVPLALLNVLFAIFVALQLPYLFGGITHLQRAAGLTMAEYARHGFFELVAVAALLLPLLLAGSALVKRADRTHERTFRWLATATLGLLGIMMTSALQRMQLYTATFGLTEDRIYATSAMLWLATVFALFAATVLRGRHAGFAFGSVVAGWVALATLNFINPEGLIVRTNVARATRGALIDAPYVTSLSADAIPDLVRALPQVDRMTSCAIRTRLKKDMERNEEAPPLDWRWWNLSRRRALRIETKASRDAGGVECPATVRESGVSVPPPI